MITKSLEDKFLKYMYSRHISSYGYGVRNLKGSKLLITSGFGLEREIPEILVTQEGIKKYLVADVALNPMSEFIPDWSCRRGDFLRILCSVVRYVE
jgi:hypothetical protein